MSDKDSGKQGLEVWVEPTRCLSIGNCAAAAPGIFELDQETMKAECVDFENATVQQLFAAARSCPTQAIIIEQYGRRVYPQILTPMYEQPDSASED